MKARTLGRTRRCYFYEPFLEAFDPALRKQLGVWYTPAEVVCYMVARVDRALKDDIEIGRRLGEPFRSTPSRLVGCNRRPASAAATCPDGGRASEGGR